VDTDGAWVRVRPEIIVLFSYNSMKEKNAIFIYRCKMYKHKSVPKYFIQDSKWEAYFDVVVGVKHV